MAEETTDAADHASLEISEEDRRVFRWRFKQMLLMDIDPIDARLMAERYEGDLGEVRKLIDRGCPPGLVVKILL